MFSSFILAKKDLNIIAVAAAFLAVQFLSFWHIAEHGIEDHEHDGQSCEIYLNSEKSKIVSANVLDVNFDNFYFIYNVSLEQLLVEFYKKSSYSRAPPILMV